MSAFDLNPALTAVRQVPGDEEVASLLENTTLLQDTQIRSASREERVAALADFDGAYAPTNVACRVVQEAIRKGRIALSYRNINDSAFSQSLLRQASMLKSRQPGLLPPSPMRHHRRVQGMLLAGASGNGRSTLMAKAAELIGTKAEPLRGTVAVPVGLYQIAVLFIRWPSCGTPEGFHYAMRGLVDSALDTKFLDAATCRSFKRAQLAPSTKSLALLVSPALLFVDGVNLSNVCNASDDLFAYLAEFMDYTGIPVVISCTFPIAARLAQLGEIGMRLGVTRAVWFDNMPYGDEWIRMVQFFWAHDLRRKEKSMPTKLPRTLHRTTNGNIACLRAVMEQLLVELINAEDKEPDVTAATTLVMAERIGSQVMMPFRPLVRLLHREATSSLIAPQDRDAWGDYLPFSAFDFLPSEDEPNRLSYRRQ
ncbi:hypothetical protein ACU4GI_14520 [Cupriavidus basilensis]